MNNSVDSNNDVSFSFSESIDITCVAKLHEQLLQLKKSDDSVIVLDGEKIERADAAGLQLLAGFFMSAKKQSITVQWNNPSEVLINSSRLMGVTELLDLAA